MATKFDRKNPQLTEMKCNAVVKCHAGVNQSQPGVILLMNALLLLNFVGRTPDRVKSNAEVKSHTGVSRCQPGVSMQVFKYVCKAMRFAVL